MKMIEEVIGKAPQGLSNPYVCRTEDGLLYYVKGLPRSSQVREWVCARLATLFGLPIAEYEILDLPEELYEQLDPEAQQSLGCGPVFASLELPCPSWFEGHSMCDSLDEAQMLDIFIFDLWVQNADRTIDNTNLLFSGNDLRVIDHNNAFDNDYSAESSRGHIFYDHVCHRLGGWVFRTEIEAKLEEVLTDWGEVMDSIPEEWHYSDPPDFTVPASTGVELMEGVLRRYAQGNMWSFL